MSSRAKSAEDGRQIDTLARVFRYVSTVVISLVAGMLTLSEFGISVAPILGAAGVVGIAVGFGAQSLVKDYFTGFFLLLENQIRQGDAIEVCGKSGRVEDITLRYVRLRDNEGSVHYIPNGQITLVTNKSCDYAFALIEIGVSYHENLEKVYAVLREVGHEMQQDAKISAKILEPLEIQGIQSFADSAVMLRCRIKTVALEQWGVRRIFLGKLKQAFDLHHIEIPYPHLTINTEQIQQTQNLTPSTAK
jgi:small conductance mechanosensitive channel